MTYFNQRFSDLIEYRGSPPPGEANYFNVGAAIALASIALSQRVEWFGRPVSSRVNSCSVPQ